jgi:hypothetical protein
MVAAHCVLQPAKSAPDFCPNSTITQNITEKEATNRLYGEYNELKSIIFYSSLRGNTYLHILFS